MKLYSYVVEHDTGHAPNPYFGVCTLFRCKYRKFAEGRRNIVELAKEGDWIIGTGGATERSAGHGKLVYAMRVDDKLTRWEYFVDSRFANKKPVNDGTFEQARGDNIKPRNELEKYEQFVLISRHFYYFGAKAVRFSRSFDIEKKGPGYRTRFATADINHFLKWLKEQFKSGKQGEPCERDLVQDSIRDKRCKSSC